MHPDSSQAPNMTSLPFQVCLLGDSGVGKTCLLRQYTDKSFGNTQTSLIDCRQTTVTVETTDVKLLIWDTSGQERFRALTASYYRGTHGIIIVFDITNLASFRNVRSWLDEINKHADDHISKLLVGNKSDLKTERSVDNVTAKRFANHHRMDYIETSAKNAENVEMSFVTMATDILQRFGIDSTENLDPDRAFTIGQNDPIGQSEFSNKQCCGQSIHPSTKMGEIDICLHDMNADKSRYGACAICTILRSTLRPLKKKSLVKKFHISLLTLDDLLEICLIGNLGVGKSCLLERFADDTFAQGNYSFGVGFRKISISTKMNPENDHLKKTQRIKVWDTVGDARYRPMMFEYIRRSHGIVIVYDTTKKGTFTSVRYWLDKIDQHAPKNVSKLLVGTKSDLTKAREVDYHTAKDLAASMLIPFLETSALMGSNVHEVFFTMTSLIKEQLRRKRRT